MFKQTNPILKVTEEDLQNHESNLGSFSSIPMPYP